MGTTESVFFDDAPIETASMPSGPPRATVAESSSAPYSSQARPRRATNGDANLAANHQYPQQRPQRRRAPSQAKPIKRMEGLVLGGPKTGKRTLLSRLKGVDPFAGAEEKKLANVTNGEEGKEMNPSITIQYKPPSESPTWDRIKLRIQYANGINDGKNTAQNQNTSTRLDFAVVLISPRDSRETTQSYLEGILTMYLDRLGYRIAAGTDDENEEKKKEIYIRNGSSTSSEPFCIAILFNFRDLEKEGKFPSASRVDLERFVHEILRSRNVLENKVVVELLETSLLDCFGLDGLHRFIYRTYLQRSQADIEKQLDVVRNQIQLTNNNNHHQTDNNTYDEFLKSITPTEAIPSSPQNRQDYQQEQTAPRRMNLPRHQKQKPGGKTPPLRMGKDALEAFLASSSDEEDAKETNKLPKSRGIMIDDSSDESDDEFFYDESGNRHQINNHDRSITAMRGKGRNDSLDDDASDSSSSDDDNEEVTQVVPSSRKGTPETPKQMHEQNGKSPPPQQTAVDKEYTATSEEEIRQEQVKSTSKETVEDEEKVAKISTAEEEKEVVGEVYTDEGYIDTNQKEKYDETDESAPVGEPIENESNREKDIDSDVDVDAKEREKYDNVVPDTHVTSNNDTDANADADVDGVNNNSCGESNNDETGVLDSNVGDFAASDITKKDSVANSNVNYGDNKENDDDICDDSDDDGGFMITSTPASKGGIENDDSGSDDDGFMITSTPAIGGGAEDDDDDGDGHMISSATADSKVPTNADDDMEEDDDDSNFIIQSIPIKDDDETNTEPSPQNRLPKSHSIERYSPGSTVDAEERKDDSSTNENQVSRKPPEPASATKTVQHSTPSSKSAASGGISQAALAAVAAAQQEAEAMIRQQQQQQYSQIPQPVMKEKKSKKKKKDEKKKKKKKKKTKGSDD